MSHFELDSDDKVKSNIVGFISHVAGCPSYIGIQNVLITYMTHYKESNDDVKPNISRSN